MDAGVAVRQLHGTEEALLQHRGTEFDRLFTATERETIDSMMVQCGTVLLPGADHSKYFDANEEEEVLN